MLLLIALGFAVEPSQIAAMPDASVSDRLGQLIAAAELSDAALDTLATTDPALVYQLRDETSLAALRFILAMSPSDIRKLRDGGSVVRTSAGWSKGESAALDELAPRLDLRATQVEAVHLRTHQAAIIRVELVGKRSATVDLAWPASWNASAVAAVVGRVAGPGGGTTGGSRGPTSAAATSGGVPIVDPGFETPSVPAWEVEVSGDGRVFWDEARHAVGKRSLRLESGRRGSVTVRQRIVPPGDTVVPASILAAPDGLEGNFSFGFQWGSSGTDEAVVALDPTVGSWSNLRLSATLPEAPQELWLVLRLTGSGAVNVDDLRVDLGAPTGISDWQRYDRGMLKVWADPMRVPDAADAAATVDRAVKGALARLGLTPSGSTRLFLYTDPADLAALGAPASNPAAGYCWQSTTERWPGACALSVFLHQVWGPPKNALLADALPRALSGSGEDLDALARASLAALPANWTASYPATGADAGPSFVAFLLEHWGAAALRAAWSGELGTIAAGGQNLAALEAAWRRELGG